MGVFDKLAFWKKKDDFDLGKDFGADLGIGPMDTGSNIGMPPQHSGNNFGTPQHGPDLSLNQPLGMPEDTGFGSMGQTAAPKPFGQPTPSQQPFGTPMPPPQVTEQDYAKDKFEVVSAKLDSIRYTLESISQRLSNLERVAYGEHEKRKGW